MSATCLYFAYGSNLNLQDLLNSDYGFEVGELKVVSKAILSDFDLRFTRYSKTRKGGVLDVVKCENSAVPGMLFEISMEETWRKLDQKEGAPKHYARLSCEIMNATTLTNCNAITYHVIEKLNFVKPHEDYIEIVRQGLCHFDLPCEHLNKAITQQYPTSMWEET